MSPERISTGAAVAAQRRLGRQHRVGGPELPLLAGEAERRAGEGGAQRRLHLVALVTDHHHHRVGPGLEGALHREVDHAAARRPGAGPWRARVFMRVPLPAARTMAASGELPFRFFEGVGMGPRLGPRGAGIKNRCGNRPGGSCYPWGHDRRTAPAPAPPRTRRRLPPGRRGHRPSGGQRGRGGRPAGGRKRRRRRRGRRLRALGGRAAELRASAGAAWPSCTWPARIGSTPSTSARRPRPAAAPDMFLGRREGPTRNAPGAAGSRWPCPAR